MYKKAIGGLVIIYVMILFAFLCIVGVQSNTEQADKTQKLLSTEKSSTMGIARITASGQRVEDCSTLERQLVYDITEEELDILQRIVEAEAGGEDEEGKLLVANVVLNRVNSEEFPDTVKEVVLQRSERVTQFSPVASGRIWRVEVSDETISAVERALNGEDISEGALFFAARRRANQDKMRWFDTSLTYLFRHGGHEFFK